MRPLLGETPLYSIAQCAVDQRRLWTRADLALIDDLADVEAVAQDVEEGALGEGHAPARIAIRQPADLRPDITLTEIEHQPVDAAECEIAREDQADPVGFVFDDYNLAIAKLIAQRHHPADPEALALGGCHLVANALGGDLPFHLGDGEQPV